ncbi:hypothetical protein [Fibrobacter sp. UWEL]|uniref:hypothetical protein n=1 Tax=Fibrobacter sp. UWEL TaxID=1896209 RepID=UPI000923924E|nr:hypothetical protein [Fibrobacter sp. UWEL]SHL35388.1 hypothetical protein SAMN05720468_12331 [Fibrobacter sp. UWEL]
MNHFMNIVAEATANKEKFDSDLNSLKASLSQSIKGDNDVIVKAAPKTGWLKGSLSYPWVLICSIAPAIKEIF